MTHKGWTIRTTLTEITATKDSEELTIYVTGERGLQLMKNAIDRRVADAIRPSC